MATLPALLSASGAHSAPNRLSLDEAPLTPLGADVQGRYGLCPIGALVANPDTPRTHSAKQIRKIARSIAVSGALAPIIVDERYMILAGHARAAACRQLGMTSVPVVQVFGASAAQKRVFLLADNRTAEDAGWDRQKLVDQLPELTLLLDAAELTIEDTGFEIGELEAMVADLDDGSDPADNVPAGLAAGPPVLLEGDLIGLGPHRLLVGDARDPDALARLCDGQKVAAAFLDPPYNVRVRDIGGRGRIRHEEFAHASGEMTRPEFVAFLETVLGNAALASVDGAVHFVCIDRKHVRDLMEAAESVYGANLDLVVWNKTNAGQGGLYRQQHELIGVFRVGAAAHRNNVQMGKYGRNRSNVWTYPGANTFRAGRMDDLAAHPTVKPLRLVADALKDVAARGDYVLDTFLGSGTTLLAAERTGRRALTLEIAPKYADIAVRRWQAFTRRDAVHLDSGLPFDELAGARAHP
jgi:16S rRNA G966 N2-methylase RsmD